MVGIDGNDLSSPDDGTRPRLADACNPLSW